MYNFETKEHGSMFSICRPRPLTADIAPFALCQVERTSIVGTLRDSSGSVLPGVAEGRVRNNSV
jgi:hypothetical protein